MVARVLKNKLNSLLRQKMQQQRLPLQIPYHRVILRFLNILCGMRADCSVGDAHLLFWSVEVKNQLLGTFTHALSEQEQQNSFDLRANLNPCALFLRLQEISACMSHKRPVNQSTNQSLLFVAE
jgi:hypothetical protein